MRLADAGVAVVVHEAAAFAGGRCRSYLDPTLGLVIDNGNHLLLSGNRAALDYLDRIGARATLRDPGAAVFDFADLDERRALAPRPQRGPHPLVAVRPEEARSRRGVLANISPRSPCS